MAPPSGETNDQIEKIKEVQKLKLYVIYRMLPFSTTLSDSFHRAHLHTPRVMPSENPGPRHVPTVPIL